jgi:phosphate starvation-inducible PhoH-like protein
MRTSIKIGRGIESLFGTRDENIRLLETALEVSTALRDDSLEIEGATANVERAERIVQEYNEMVREGHVFSNGALYHHLRVLTEDPATTLRGLVQAGRQRNFGKRAVQPKSANQQRYMEAIDQNDMVFGIGPAGTGKTYLAVAMAVSALLSKKISRIILARPAVEAGERLGFLPGTVQEKVDPYLRPLYDALYDMLDAEKVERYLERDTIEIAPIAFMRGRTLNNCFAILDEAQNTTGEQMKMFLTRLGFDSKAVITGDITQIDLPSGKRSGLLQAIDIVSGIRGISFVYFNERDVVRHSLVQRIIKAYEVYESQNGASNGTRAAAGGNGAAVNGRATSEPAPAPAAGQAPADEAAPGDASGEPAKPM